MPRYVVNAASTEASVIVESPDLHLGITDGWATFTDDRGILLTVPREHLHSIQRIDQDHPATNPDGPPKQEPATPQADPAPTPPRP
ncbi:hypothetical protein B4N89_27830 [Embleya scabrispora]|uniref:Uncharacterized protein n=1 Tax=Embleya scabrispora TaxID=159449 RepID=A0A1T3P597_9ACTN|nr:hypothetical protein [Embleya scabrispora]OPC84233.1 hypothetical protein B4N89_27830 [Embleya scabrispora]